MNLAQMIDRLASRTGMERATAESAVRGLFDARRGVIADALAAGETVVATGFGKWEVRTHAAHVGRNPRTGEEVPVAAYRVPAFRAGRGLRERLR